MKGQKNQQTHFSAQPIFLPSLGWSRQSFLPGEQGIWQTGLSASLPLKKSFRLIPLPIIPLTHFSAQLIFLPFSVWSGDLPVKASQTGSNQFVRPKCRPV